MKYRNLHVFLFYYLVVLTGLSQSEEKDKDLSIPNEAYIAIVSIGPLPEISYEGDTIAIQEAGKEPPVIYRTKGADGKFIHLRGGANRIGPFSRILAQKTLSFECLMSPESGKWDFYMEVPSIEPGSRSIVFLKPKGEFPYIWLGKPQIDVVNLDSKSFKKKDIVLTNFSKEELVVRVGKRKILLSSNQIVAIKVNDSEAKAISILASSLDKPDHFLIKTTIPVLPLRLNLLSFYTANPKTNRGRSLGFFRTGVPKPHQIILDEFGNEISPKGFEHEN